MTNPPQTVSEAQVQQVAALSNLELTPQELPAMERDLNAILGYFAQLNELDVANVLPMAQASELLSQGDRGADEDTPLRADVLAPSLERDTVLRSAPDTDGAFFRVPRVIER